MGGYLPPPRRSLVTMSGLLNVIDGVGSEEGKLFFATTNYIDRLDPALLRPGRIDRKVEYRLATQEQAEALYVRFFPDRRLAEFDVTEKAIDLAKRFAQKIPADEFSTAELQGYLLGHKKTPGAAVHGIEAWIGEQRQEKKDKKERQEKRQQKIEEEMKKRSMLPSPLSPMPLMPTYDIY